MTSVLFSVSDVANELNCTPVEAQRLIARGILSATRLGDTYRTTAGAIEKYILSDAPMLRLPELAGDWFDNTLVNLADVFASKLMVAAGEQSPSDDRIKADFLSRPDLETLDYPIGLTGSVADLCRSPVPEQTWGEQPAGTANSRFKTWADLYLCEQFRNAARAECSSADRGAAPIYKLYETPEAFVKITDAAYVTLAQRRIVASKTYTMVGGPFKDIPVSRTAHFLFSVGNLATPGNKARLVGLSF